MDVMELFELQRARRQDPHAELELALESGDGGRVQDAIAAIEGAEHGPRREPRVSKHAIDRFIQRVDPTLSRSSAERAIRTMLRNGTSRPKPRHWMRSRPTPGLRFVYLHERADVCLLVVGATVVTVITRARARDTLRAGTQVAQVIPIPLPARPPEPSPASPLLAA